MSRDIERHLQGITDARQRLTTAAFLGAATVAVDTADLREVFLGLSSKNEVIRRLLDRMQELERDMFANIPLSPADREWDPNDQFTACAKDRARRVQEARVDMLSIATSKDTLSVLGGDDRA
ncbi:hypothetical protein F8O07_06725 [Pseudoclavibacter sp. CFCC 13796]|uniref:hypothetical protein n=1 Tax=Pseudoclavibacter sp. CFCC 13796 TaxID=2615179 RepID=UPI00130179C6|nr:hypothetical protein [Pseudoclavibacter sp. CFCC 13796]KAB1661593.1 hypothetical protein F8O07_06725 [Pseudoclavibacter sp. CFCC 13796]